MAEGDIDHAPNYIVEREVGYFPLSIGTSLALEGLLRIHPDSPPQPTSATRVAEVWVNLRTLIRNLYAAMTAEESRRAPLSQCLELLIEELRSLPDIMQQQARGKYRLVLYYDDISELAWMLPHAKHKQPRTEKQHHYRHFEEMLLGQLIYQAAEYQLTLLAVRRQPPPTPNVVALLTHHPHELLWRFQFTDLLLLESHTGKLKTASQWSTKLTGVTRDDHLPFTRLTLQLFGEGSLLGSFEIALRREIKALAQQHHWTTVTTEAKLVTDIKRSGSDTLKRTVDALLIG